MLDIDGLNKHIYEQDSVPNVVKAYTKELRSNQDAASVYRNTMVASKLEEYLEMISDKSYLKTIRNVFDELYDEICARNLFFRLDGRRKGLKSFVKKILLKLEKGESVDEVQDGFAFRVTVFDTYPEEMVEECYKIMNHIVCFMGKKGFILCNNGMTTEVGYKPHEGDKKVVIIPERSLLDEPYRGLIKDYIISPKKNGYQSLHAVFRDRKTGRTFEIQIRTHTMHINAEYGDANHTDYKEQKYDKENDTKKQKSEKEFETDINKIHMRGFRVTGRVDQPYEDLIGLLDSLNLITRQHTFDLF